MLKNKKKVVPPLPDNIIFEVTTRCNHVCDHCYNAWKNRTVYPDVKELPTKKTLTLLQKVLDQVGVELVTLTGGEPLLRSDFFDIVDFLHEKNVAINLITNGTLLSEQVIERLGPSKIRIFELPILSSKSVVHDALSGITGAFDKVTEAIANLKLSGQMVIGVFVATKKNIDDFRGVLELALALGIDGVMFNRFNPGGHGFENIEKLQVDPERLCSALDCAESFSEQYGLPVSCSIPMPPCLFDTSHYKHLGFGFCAAGTDRAYYTIDPAGNLRPCNHSVTILGNLYKKPFHKLISSEKMQAFMNDRPSVCNGCKHELECQGGCKASAEVCFGSRTHADPFLDAFFDRAKVPRT